MTNDVRPCLPIIPNPFVPHGGPLQEALLGRIVPMFFIITVSPSPTIYLPRVSCLGHQSYDVTTS